MPVRVTPRGEALIHGEPLVTVTLVEDVSDQVPPPMEGEALAPQPRVNSRRTNRLSPLPPALAEPRRVSTPRSAH